MYPREVQVDENNLEAVIKTYESAYKNIVDEIATATDWGAENRRKILKQIEIILTDLGEDAGKWIEKNIPNMYVAGADDAISQLNNIGAPVDVATGFNRIHQDAIAGLVDETATAFGEGLTGINRQAQLLLGRFSREALTQKMAEGIIGGQALATVRKQIKGQLVEQGLAAMIDRGGHSWTLDRYADMLFRTKLVEARNRGIANRLVENGYDLVQVSSTQTDHAECAVWEGKVLSASGATPGFPTVMDAQMAGLFHPNCKHAINVLSPSLANLTQAYNPDTKTINPAGASIRKPFEDVVQKTQIDPAEKIQADFKAKLKSIGGTVGPVKQLDRATDKVINDYNGDALKLKDGNRGKIIIDNPWDKQQFEDIKGQVLGVFDIDETAGKNKLDKDEGYAMAMINVKLPGGRLAEVQVTYKEMWWAKNEGGGEDLYKLVRAGKDPDGIYQAKMDKLYRDAYLAARARIGLP